MRSEVSDATKDTLHQIQKLVEQALRDLDPIPAPVKTPPVAKPKKRHAIESYNAVLAFYRGRNGAPAHLQACADALRSTGWTTQLITQKCRHLVEDGHLARVRCGVYRAL